MVSWKMIKLPYCTIVPQSVIRVFRIAFASWRVFKLSLMLHTVNAEGIRKKKLFCMKQEIVLKFYVLANLDLCSSTPLHRWVFKRSSLPLPLKGSPWRAPRRTGRLSDLKQTTFRQPSLFMLGNHLVNIENPARSVQLPRMPWREH